MTDLATTSQEAQAAALPPAQTTAVETAQTQSPAPAAETITHEGQSYSVPKPLLQAIAQRLEREREAHERLAPRAEPQGATGAPQEALRDLVRLIGLNETLGEFERTDWAGLAKQDGTAAQVRWMEYQQAKDARDSLVGRLREAEARRRAEAEAELGRRRKESDAVLARDITAWSPELRGRLFDYGVQEFALTREELQGTSDPRLIKVLHRAFEGDRVRKEKEAAERAAQNESLKPLTMLGSGGSGTKDPERMSTEEWMRYEQERLRSRRR